MRIKFLPDPIVYQPPTGISRAARVTELEHSSPVHSWQPLLP
jgi:hypothetical protein